MQVPSGATAAFVACDLEPPSWASTPPRSLIPGEPALGELGGAHPAALGQPRHSMHLAHRATCVGFLPPSFPVLSLPLPHQRTGGRQALELKRTSAWLSIQQEQQHAPGPDLIRRPLIKSSPLVGHPRPKATRT